MPKKPVRPSEKAIATPSKQHAKKITAQAAKDKAREARLRLIFNTNSIEYEKVLTYQNGVCAITQRPTTQLYLDHDHADGQLRGLLSYKVNKGLAYFGDDPELLRRAAAYLENPPYTLAVGEPVYGVIGRVTKKAKNRKYGPHGTKTPQPRTAKEDRQKNDSIITA